MSFQQNRPPQATLRVRDLPKAVEFYRQGLGFCLAAHDGRSATVVQDPGGISLLLAGGSDSLDGYDGKEMAPGAWVYLHRPGLPEYAAELAARGIATLGDAGEPYPGFRQLLIPDPDGYCVAFWESLPLADAEVLALYRSGPARLRTALEGLAEADLDRAYAAGKWTVRQIVHHLVDADLGTFQVLRGALAGSGRQWNPNLWDPDDWADQLGHAHRPVGAGVALLDAARTWVLEVVECLPDPLERHVVWPSGRRAIVRELLQQVGGHAVHHIMQIERARGRR